MLKKIIPLLLIVTLMFSLAVPAFATEGDGETTPTDQVASTVCPYDGGEHKYGNDNICEKCGQTNPSVEEAESVSPMQAFLSTLPTLLIMVAIVLVFWLLFIRPQRKQEKEVQKMRSSIEVGDQITTIGGITGFVRQIKEEEDIYIIETAADKSKLAVRKWAIQSKDTISDDKA